MSEKHDELMTSYLKMLDGVKTDEIVEILRKKIPNLKCIMCHKKTMNVIGTHEKLFTFGWPAATSDTMNDGRKYVVTLVECSYCGHVHAFSPARLMKEHSSEDEE
ncbi:hypothetical protein SJS84_06565 [Aeromonas caviae]|uniref:hypothetical protein n=1 Tax=Aeromonas caviae TaxID=648 RepID=UPI0029D71BDB|nr:hypothetical protein [Aeromonas caviae]MDX7790364.1 hypothetical protein [Aeromonas caviae]